MKSHEYAEGMKQAAEFLLSRPEFETQMDPLVYLGYYLSKEKFLDVVRALGSGHKEYQNGAIKFENEKHGAKIQVSIRRSEVCRLVKAAEYECVPLLSIEEEASLESAPTD
jgi:hypothetical protein